MGGGDLNSKKSWHPHTLKNQEQVWKAEQAKALEEKKLEDLRKEIQQERDMEDLKRAGRESGVLSGGHEGDKKLDWMYKSTHELINREEYLLGRKIDKSFEALQAEEQQKEKNNLVGVKQPLNHVEHECVPFSIRAYKNIQSTEQVDLQRKFMEDPLMLIKQREMETRRKILENPVKLKELHKILKTDEKLKKEAKKPKKSKKSKKPKKKHKKRSKSSSSNSSESDSNSDNDSDIDSKLAKKLKVGLLDEKDFLEKGLNIDKILDSKYEKISQELDKAAKSKHKSKKKKRKDSSESDDEDNFRKEKYQDGRKGHNKHESEHYNRQNGKRDSSERRKRSPIKSSHKNRYNDRDRSRSKSIDRTRRRSRSTSRNRNVKRNNNRTDKSPSPDTKRFDRRRNRSSSLERSNRYNRTKREDRSRSPRNRRVSRSPSSNRRTNRSRSRSNEKSSRHRSSYKARSRSSSPRRRVDSQKFPQRSRSPRRSPKSNRKLSPKSSSTAASTQRPSGRLTDEEKQQRLKEMMANAEWREEERSHAVRKHREDYAREEEQNKNREFDKDFLNKEVKKAIANQTSVGSRLRANLNNIQRTSSSMNDNFIRK
ncbi:pre-mRNA-splicing factor CWC25 homolog [Musca vetustissima]|uniref:pre-mRNA-splicing factor CWC25 homolog n=1 Tax=Musca vetustissima TaxID=27455 RepID=UPI002AB6EEEA|nr:pre-mRNA-splicing factor CWC25 homolog [Musca vetustissima]